jgi:hypothetical protein
MLEAPEPDPTCKFEAPPSIRPIRFDTRAPSSEPGRRRAKPQQIGSEIHWRRHAEKPAENPEGEEGRGGRANVG